MANTLKDNNITATLKQIGKNLTDLKNYYRGQKRIIESSKSNGAATDEVHVSPWEFRKFRHFKRHFHSTENKK